MKTKVAVVLPYFGPGGAENMVSRLVSNLDLSELDVKVFCVYGDRQNNALEERIEKHGVPIHYIRKPTGFSLSAVHRLNKELSKFAPDVINTHLSGGFYSSYWVMCHRVKMLHTVHNIPAYEAEKIKRAVYALLYRTGKAVPVALSKTIRDLIQQTYKVKEDIELIYNPVDVERFSSVKKVPHDNFVFLMVGRLSKQKHQIVALDAFRSLVQDYPNTKLVILGEGPERDNLNDFIVENGLENKVSMPGNVDNVEQYMASSDAFILSSDYEGLPLVLLEAMAAKLPIISTNVGGVQDIVENCAILTQPNNAKEMSLAMRELLTNKEIRNSFCKTGFNNVQKYDSRIISEQYKELYKKYRHV